MSTLFEYIRHVYVQWRNIKTIHTWKDNWYLATNTYKRVKHVGIIAIFCILLLLSSTICDSLPNVFPHFHWFLATHMHNASCKLMVVVTMFFTCIIMNSTGSTCGLHVYSPALSLLSWKANSSGGGYWLAGDHCIACILTPWNTHTHCMCLSDIMFTWYYVHPYPHYVHVCIYMYSYRCILCRWAPNSCRPFAYM